jgi:hypothetical protein
MEGVFYAPLADEMTGFTVAAIRLAPARCRPRDEVYGEGQGGIPDGEVNTHMENPGLITADAFRKETQIMVNDLAGLLRPARHRR